MDLHNTTEFLQWAHKDKLNTSEDFILKSLDPDKTVLDAGTGGGRFLHVLKSRGFDRLTGFDYSTDLIDVARKRDVSGSIQFDVSGAEKLPYVDEQFDQCLYLQQIISLIELKEGRLSALRELKRVLKKGGVAYLSLLFREPREKTPAGFLLKGYLALVRIFFHSVGKYKTFLTAENSTQAGFPKKLEETGTVKTSSKALRKVFQQRRHDVSTFQKLLDEVETYQFPHRIMENWYERSEEFSCRHVPLSMQPMLKVGGRPNWGFFRDARPYVCWYSFKEAFEDIQKVGLVVYGVATDHQLEEGGWLKPEAFDGKVLKGFLYIKCGKDG